MELLSGLGAAIAILLAGLSFLAFTMFRLFRVAEMRAAEIQSAGARMHTVVETSPLGIVVTDEEGAIREFNRAAEHIFGYTRADAIGRKAVRLLVPPEKRDESAWRLLEFVTQARRLRPGYRQNEFIAMKRCGTRFPAEISIDRAEGNDPIFVSYIQDISGRKDAEVQLTDARDKALAGERAKSQFLAVMSHEMRTPLNGLLGTMQLMEDEELSARPRALLARMEVSGRHLLGLVNDVLDLAKYEAGKMRAENAPFSLSSILDDVVDSARPMAEAFGNELSWHWAGPPSDSACGDERRIRQVLLNLAGNAVKFTRDGNISIEAEWVADDGNGGGEFEFRVIDTGIGIEPRDISRIFSDFETLDTSYAREAGGTGLGLGISSRLASLMGGRIGAESVPGFGSLFWLRLPLQMLGKQVAADLSPRISGGNTLVSSAALDVLVVEDNELNRFIARRMLEHAGHRVVEAENGEAGVERAAVQKFDVILMDISMPIMDGTEAVKRIRTGNGVSSRVPIVALTAHALPEEQVRFRSLGMAECLSKPVNRKELLDTLARVTSDSATKKSA